ncbi:CHRD domain-containing protein [Acetobacter nitrogenifigens]|uniref:CHRD domain-containing protein n=2 Tax=Acetobacter nitrogenifigens TaxID=285268 RepID=A0A511X7F3_9PROT|nr:CHRD domain-containing protein [Acetobacter nitrogenifigens]GEN58883.1 hypothetical protein ANI02nite_07670 [Acetobacter nitrogenifigens DSM 23921 = NBRC 105050]
MNGDGLWRFSAIGHIVRIVCNWSGVEGGVLRQKKTRCFTIRESTMNTISKILTVAGLTLVSAAALTATARAEEIMYMGEFKAEHGATNAPTGDVMATLDTTTNVLKYTIKWKGLTGPVTVAHFHGPAKDGVDAGIVAPIDGPYANPLSGQVTLTSAQEDELANGLVYVNLHTKAFPKGEARAQLSK